MIIKSLKHLYHRDLVKLKEEIAAYRQESHLWIVAPGIKNSGGNLCLHLVGNLNAYIGIGLTKTDYIRDREYEFSAKNVKRQVLIKSIEEVMKVVESGLDAISDEQLSNDYPIVIWRKPTNMAYTLIHLHSHLNYHLGQINYHRRLLDSDKQLL